MLLDLPVHLSHFVGRERELSDLGSLLDSRRLLTLTGAGGSGKTRLAAQVATRHLGAFSRVGWADLAPLSSDAQVAMQITRALQVAERHDVSAVDALIADVGSTPTLLVMDNCEHVVERAAGIAEELLRGCANLKILATSREALSISSETAWLVPPLEREEAIQLFIARARAAMPAFVLSASNASAVAEICRRLDGIPLAIELAAARVRALTPVQIAERLDNVFKLLTAGSRTALPRQRTLRGTMDWSYALLNAREQALLRRLSVFVGSFSLDAAEAVCQGEPLTSDDILDGVTALVDKSLVVMEANETDARYHLLETVRQYADEQLADANERARTEEAHAMHYLQLLEALHPHIIGGEDETGLIQRLQADGANLQTACAWTLKDPTRLPIAHRFAHALFWYCYGIAEFAFGKAFFDSILAATTDAHSPLWRGRTLVARGFVALSEGRTTEVRTYFDEAIPLLEAHGAAEGELLTVYIKRAAAHVLDGHPQLAVAEMAPYAERALRSPIVMVTVFYHFWSGWAALLLGDLVKARYHLQANIDAGIEHAHETIIAHGSVLLGRLAMFEGADNAARHHFREALIRHRMMGEGWGFSLGLGSLARLALARGDHTHAALLQAGLDGLRERIGMAVPEPDRADREGVIEATRAALGDDEFARLAIAGRELSRRALIDLAISGVDQITAPALAPVPGSLTITGTFRAAMVPPALLRIRALGPLQVTRGDDAIDGAAWGSSRSRALLMFLLLHPNGATKEQVGVALWPDVSTTQLRNSFHVTLHRLRKAIGAGEVVVLSEDRYHVDPMAIGEFDVARFERDVAEARGALKRGDADAPSALARAVSLYRGDLLDGEPVGDWHLPFRDRLRALFVEASLELGAWQMQDERFELAADTFRRLLAHDSAHETAVRGLMTCLARTGESRQALRSYEKLVEALKRDFNTKPEAITTALAERIQQGQSA